LLYFSGNKQSFILPINDDYPNIFSMTFWATEYGGGLVWLICLRQLFCSSKFVHRHRLRGVEAWCILWSWTSERWRHRAVCWEPWKLAVTFRRTRATTSVSPAPSETSPRSTRDPAFYTDKREKTQWRPIVKNSHSTVSDVAHFCNINKLSVPITLQMVSKCQQRGR